VSAGHVSADQVRELDLSCWAVACNGSEPVRAETLRRFAAAFAPASFRSTSFCPAYGLAEATLLVTGVPAGRQTTVAPPLRSALPTVSCGPWVSGDLAVVRGGQALPDGAEGEVWVCGANVAAGYWRRPDDTARVFQARLPGRPGTYLRTGDLGFIRDGELYLTGRLKDLLVVRGRNHYPQDIEATVAEASDGIRHGFVAAFSVPARELPDGSPDDTSEKLVIVAERGPGAGRADPQPIIDAVRKAVSRKHAVNTYDVRLVAAGVIPRTTSGKLARRACRAEYIEGTLSTR
jgi:fatty-acyl-CoA synthase